MSKASEWWAPRNLAPPSKTWRYGDVSFTATVTEYGLQFYVGTTTTAQQVNVPREGIVPLLEFLIETFSERSDAP
jgi:hypothetical protein